MKSDAKLLVTIPLSLIVLTTAAHAAFVGYAPGAPTSNFSTPTAFNDTVAYNTSVTSDQTYVHLNVTADPASGGTFNPGQNWANLYVSTSVVGGTGGSGVGFEVNNNRAFKPGFAGYFDTSDNGFIVSITPGVVDVQIPWTYFTSDPDAIGFMPITAANNIVRLNLSQSFSYSVAGANNANPNGYGVERLGTTEYVAPVPEPSTYLAGALLLLPFGARTLRHLRNRKPAA